MPLGLVRFPHLKAITVSWRPCLISVDVPGVFAAVKMHSVGGACESADPIKDGQPAVPEDSF